MTAFMWTWAARAKADPLQSQHSQGKLRNREDYSVSSCFIPHKLENACAASEPLTNQWIDWRITIKYAYVNVTDEFWIQWHPVASTVGMEHSCCHPLFQPAGWGYVNKWMNSETNFSGGV